MIKEIGYSLTLIQKDINVSNGGFPGDSGIPLLSP
jgi:hypothetical protein